MDARKSAAIACVKPDSARPQAGKVRRSCAGVLALLAALSLAGCYGMPLSTREKGTLIGGAVGAGGGALVGSAVGSPGAGAAIGGLGGAGVGYLIGNQMQNREYGYGGYGGYGNYYRYGGY
jgi:osmotically inducible lipoprotein OsmB